MDRYIPELLFTGPAVAPVTFAFAHGAGVPIDHPFMNTVAQGVSQAGIRVARFEFPYMQARRIHGTRRPPNRAPALIDTWLTMIEALGGGELGGSQTRCNYVAGVNRNLTSFSS
mgnify:CR=1 FL=1